MTTHKISTTVTTSVILGTGNYGTTLRITQTGEIQPGDASAALVVPAGLKDVVIHNAGLICGGYGNDYGDDRPGGAGGIGIDLSSTSFVSNTGIVAGGYGGSGYLGLGGAGGTGVEIGAASTLTNHTSITGGHGGYAYYDNAGGGGVGVDLSARGHLTNLGMITGGAGGFETGVFYHDGSGGAGVHIHNEAMLFNAGTITGGQAGQVKSSYGGRGGVGVFIDGGTLINAGSISGGESSAGSADAVKFGTLSGTLVVDPEAVFNGRIDATGGAANMLVLAGTSDGQLAGFGTSIKGFATIVEDAHANWTLAGAIGGNVIRIGAGGTLTLDNAVSTATIAFARGTEGLGLGAPTMVTSVLHGFTAGDTIDLSGLQATSFTYGAGTLTLYDAQNAVIDTLAFAGKYTEADFSLSPDGNGGTDVAGVHALPHGVFSPAANWQWQVHTLAWHHPLA